MRSSPLGKAPLKRSEPEPRSEVRGHISDAPAIVHSRFAGVSTKDRRSLSCFSVQEVGRDTEASFSLGLFFCSSSDMKRLKKKKKAAIVDSSSPKVDMWSRAARSGTTGGVKRLQGPQR